MSAAGGKTNILGGRVNHNGAGFLQAVLDEGLPLGATGGSHGDGAESAVSPVDVAVDPVDGQSLRSRDVAADDRAVLGGVSSRVHQRAEAEK